MKSFALTNVVLAFMAAVLALPTSNTITNKTIAPEYQASGSLGIYLCTQANWNGACFHNTNIASDQCFNWQIVGSFIESIGPDEVTQCFIFDKYNCAGGRERVTFPGIGNLAAVGWGNRLESFFCTAGDPSNRGVKYAHGVPGPYANITVVDEEWPFVTVDGSRVLWGGGSL